MSGVVVDGDGQAVHADGDVVAVGEHGGEGYTAALRTLFELDPPVPATTPAQRSSDVPAAVEACPGREDGR